MSEAEPAPLDMARAVWQLRALVCGLGAMVLVLSLAFNLFVWKQNRNVTIMAHSRQQQLTQLQARGQDLTAFANELANYSNGRPELMGIFARYGIEVRAKSLPPQP